MIQLLDHFFKDRNLRIYLQINLIPYGLESSSVLPSGVTRQQLGVALWKLAIRLTKDHQAWKYVAPIHGLHRWLAYAMSKAIADLFKPLVGKTSYHIKNTVTFSKELKNLQVNENEIMNSHDVVSLFTNVPIKKSLEVIRKKLEEDKTLSDHTNLDVNDMMNLLEFMMSTMYFQFDGQYCQQVHGSPMGSPFSFDMLDMFWNTCRKRPWT